MAVTRAKGIAGLAIALTCLKLANFSYSSKMLVLRAEKKDFSQRINAILRALHLCFYIRAAKDREYKAEQKHVRRYVTLGGRFNAMRKKLGEAVFFLLHKDVSVSYIKHMR